MNIDPNHKKIVEEILNKIVPQIEVRAFGSRVKGTNRKQSDLDLALVSDSKIDLMTLFLLEEAFDESDLPFKVDVIDYCRVDSKFREIIDEQYVVLRK